MDCYWLANGFWSWDVKVAVAIFFGIIAVLGTYATIRNFILGRKHRATIRFKPYNHFSDEDNFDETGYEVEVENHGLPLFDLDVYCEERGSEAEAALQGLKGRRMKQVGTAANPLQPGDVATFRVTDAQMKDSRLLTTPMVRHAVRLVQNLKEDEILISVYRKGGKLVKRAIFKKDHPGEMIWTLTKPPR